MRRLTGIEVAAIVLALFFVLVGLLKICRPSDRLIFHGPNRFFPPSVEYISPERSRTFGLLAVLLGAGIIGAVVYRRRK